MMKDYNGSERNYNHLMHLCGMLSRHNRRGALDQMQVVATVSTIMVHCLIKHTVNAYIVTSFILDKLNDVIQIIKNDRGLVFRKVR
jgi:hypothetical protein